MPDLEDLRRRAETGDARAQYALAAALAGAGKREEADVWLARAAEGGEPEAHFTLATRLLQTKAGLGEARALLERSVGGGSTAAMRALAVLKADGFGATPDWSGALALVLKAAEAVDSAAARDLAALLFLQDEEDADGAALLQRAATHDPVAGAVLVRRAIEGRADRAEAASVLKKLAGAGYPRAASLERALTAAPAAASRAPLASEPDWARVTTKLARMDALARADSARPSRRVAQEPLSASPRAYAVRAALPPEILEYVMAASARRLAPSMTFDPATGVPRKDEYRTSLTATLGPADQDLTLVAINHLLAAIVGIDHSRAEFLSVLRYAPGEEYRPHFDWIPPTGRDFAQCGQRVATALLYLNDDYEGGETHLMSPDIAFKGAPGDVLVFWNVTEGGAPDDAARHAGLPVRSGAKWLASKWFREREFAF